MMRRNDFAEGKSVAKFFDEKSGYTLYPYTQHIIKPSTIWRSNNGEGMLFIKKRKPIYSDDEEDSAPTEIRWDIRWRTHDGEEEVSGSIIEEEILREFSPVFVVI